MTHAPSDTHATSHRARRTGVLHRILQATAIFLGICEVGWIVHLTLASAGPDITWTLVHLPLVMGTIFLARRLASGRQRNWAEPARRLQQLIKEVRNGQTPIDELSTITGPLSPLASSMQELLREVRQEKKARAALELEIRQKVQHRTDALERVIGTLKTKASRDALTGLFNRRLLDEMMPRVIEQCRKEQTPLCVMMLDVDNFKLLNDTLGHAAGDEMLRSIGQLIRSSCRDEDLAFRNGGDEFVVLLPACELATADGLAQRITSLVDQLVKPMKVSPKPGISIGILCAGDLSDATPTMLLQRADRAMYQRKAARKVTRTIAAKPVAPQDGSRAA